MSALPLKADKQQTSPFVRYVPILLQKSAIVAARLPARSLGTALTIRSLPSGDAGSNGTDPWHRLRKTCIGRWWGSSDQLREPAEILRDCGERELILRATWPAQPQTTQPQDALEMGGRTTVATFHRWLPLSA